jgi:ubiquinone/menaquinone biosynthesis C-methylase UbiE
MNDVSSKTFWDRNARLYDWFVRKDAAAYAEVCRMICARVRKTDHALEIATGTGLIALNVAAAVGWLTATDFSAPMIAQARQKGCPCNVTFELQDATALAYPDQSFDAVIISNALHIMPDPVRALSEIRRVLKNDGVLFAPNFTHKGMSFLSRLKAGIAKIVGFCVFSEWSPEDYLAFLNQHGFSVTNSAVLNASFPLTYAEAIKR